MTDYANILREVGYKNLIDRGSYWQTSALFREGDNRTSIRIYKNSGVWSDFVEGDRPLPFEVLLKKTLKTNNVEQYIKNGSAQTYSYNSTQKLLKEEKTFPEESLKRLLPDRKYFEEERGIPSSVQAAYQCGLATGGKLYQRIVFPIRRKDGKIHAFIGRSVNSDSSRVKWLNYGKSAEWFYPYYTVSGVKEQINKEGRLFLVESVGDSLALYRSGVKNNIVAFTNRIQPKLTSKLAFLDKDIVLSFNNDFDDKEGQNRGFDGALVSLLKLSDCMDLNRIWFCPPPKEDFGEMNDEEIKQWRSSLDFSGSSIETLRELIDYAPKAKIAKTLIPKVNKLVKQLES